MRENNYHQSWFLEAPLVRQADGELKNNLVFLKKNIKVGSILYFGTLPSQQPPFEKKPE